MPLGQSVQLRRLGHLGAGPRAQAAASAGTGLRNYLWASLGDGEERIELGSALALPPE